MLVTTAVAVLPLIGSEVAVKYPASKVVILPIPDEAITTYRQGC